MGNRGILHDDQGTLGSARRRHKNWIVCVPSFKDRHRTVKALERWAFGDAPPDVAHAQAISLFCFLSIVGTLTFVMRPNLWVR
jgi:hypothetical protein